MKRISISFFVLFLVSFIFSGCQENIYMDWKLANDRFYNSLEDSMKYYASTNYTLLSSVYKQSNPPMTRDTDKITGAFYYYKLYYGGTPGDIKPNANGNCYILVDYKGSLINDSVFDKSTNAQFTLSSTITGWKDVLPNFSKNAHLKLYVPSVLAYDTATTKLPTIPPHSLLIFDIRLKDVQNYFY
ncbi:MAG: FKBP-type peptidyl-prolyl cis-trans isomerase [Paludibacter sp.]